MAAVPDPVNPRMVAEVFAQRFDSLASKVEAAPDNTDRFFRATAGGMIRDAERSGLFTSIEGLSDYLMRLRAKHGDSLGKTPAAYTDNLRSIFAFVEMRLRRAGLLVGNDPTDISFDERGLPSGRNNIRGACRVIAAVLRTEAPSEAPLAPEIHDDGPDIDHPGVFYWGNRPYQIGNAAWKICSAVWQNAGISFLTVADIVWGEEKQPGTIKSALSRLNEKMIAHNLPLQWVCCDEKIYLDDGPQN